MRAEQHFEFEQLVSGKSLNLAIRRDAFTSEPNEKLTAPIRWKNVRRQHGPEPCRPVTRGGQHVAAAWTKDRAPNLASMAFENGQQCAGVGLPQARSVVL